MNEVREFGRISDEENRGIVENPIPVSLICPKLDSKPTGISGGIGRSRLASHGGETDGRTNLLTNRTQERLGCNVAEVMSYFKVTVGSGAFGVYLERRNITHMKRNDTQSTYDSLWNTFTIEMRKEIDVVKVFLEGELE
jgi:hypothetical protein